MIASGLVESFSHMFCMLHAFAWKLSLRRHHHSHSHWRTFLMLKLHVQPNVHSSVWLDCGMEVMTLHQQEASTCRCPVSAMLLLPFLVRAMRASRFLCACNCNCGPMLVYCFFAHSLLHSCCCLMSALQEGGNLIGLVFRSNCHTFS